MPKELLFSVARKDFDIQFFRAGGKGGQKQNKTSSGCRIIHKDSGAVGEARDNRSQFINKKNAFLRCVKNEKFQSWIKLEISKHVSNEKTIDQIVDDWMQSHNIKTEYL